MEEDKESEDEGVKLHSISGKSSLRNVYSGSLPISLNQGFLGVFVCLFVLLLSCRGSLYILNVSPHQIYGLQIFFPFHRLSFQPVVLLMCRSFFI